MQKLRYLLLVAVALVQYSTECSANKFRSNNRKPSNIVPKSHGKIKNPLQLLVTTVKKNIEKSLDSRDPGEYCVSQAGGNSEWNTDLILDGQLLVGIDQFYVNPCGDVIANGGLQIAQDTILQGNLTVTGTTRLLGFSTANSSNFDSNLTVSGRVYVPALNTTTVTGAAVLVNSNGQLGVLISKGEAKEEFVNLKEKVSGLNDLSPVSFIYKDDKTRHQHFGLVAEQVEKVYPQLVIYDNNGKALSVAYHELPALLVAGYQEQQKMIDKIVDDLAILLKK